MVSSERELPSASGVHTPPRDDLATRPRLVHITDDHDAHGLDQKRATALCCGCDAEQGGFCLRMWRASAATRQACCLTLGVICVMVVFMAAMAGLYSFVNKVYSGGEDIVCKEQAIIHGVIKAGVANASAVVRCDDGFVQRREPDPDLRCRVVYQDYDKEHTASLTDPTLYSMKKVYAYFKPQPGQKAMQVTDNDAGQDREQSLEAIANLTTQGICEPSSQWNTQGLFGVMHGQILTDSPRGRGTSSNADLAAPTTAGTASFAAVAMPALAMLSLGALVWAGVVKSQQGSHNRRGRHAEPDNALSDDDEIALLNAEEGETENLL